MNKVVHFEIPVDNLDRAKIFYSIFGWKLEDMDMPGGMKYTMATTVETDEKHMPKEAGAINGGLMQRTKDVHSPVVAINVISIDDCIKKVEAKGGRVVMPKVEMGGMGYYAYIVDSEANVIGLWEDIHS